MLKYLLLSWSLLLAAYSPGLHAQKLQPAELSEAWATLGKPMADTARAKLYLKLAERYSHEPFPELDSALYYCDQARQVSQSINFQWGLATSDATASDVYRKKNDRTKGSEVLIRARDRAEKYRLTDVLIEAYLTMGYYWPDEFNDKDYLELALQTSIASKNQKEEQRSLIFLAFRHALSGHYRQAVERRLRALELSKTSGEPFTAEDYAALGSNYRMIGNHEEAIKYGLEAIRLSEEATDTTYIFTLANRYNFLGNTYFAINQYEKALVNFKKAVAAGRHYKKYVNLTTMICNVSTSLTSLKRYNDALKNLDSMSVLFPAESEGDSIDYNISYVEIYLAMKRSKEALSNFHRLEAYYKKNDENASFVGTTIIQYCIDAGMYDKAQQYLYETRKIYKKIDQALEFRMTYGYQYKLDSLRGNYLGAMRNYQRYRAIGDSLSNKQRAEQIREIEVVYETQKKDQNIRLLTNETELKGNQLHTANLIRNITIGGVIVLIVFIALLYNRYQLKQRTSDEISEKNNTLQQLVTEKEWLVKEIHHRVKNNLQTIVSLLRSQSQFLNNSDALHAILDSQNRVHAMSLIHQKLYMRDSDTRINLSDYLHDLVRNLDESMNTYRIGFSIDIAPIDLDVSRAVPVGLIVNEAITNSIKYAFSNTGKHNQISLHVGQAGDGKIILTIADNGVGLPPDFDADKRGGLGLMLIRGLAGDIDADLTLESNHGLKIRIAFSAEV